VALWCGHYEPLALDIEPGIADASPARTALRFAALQELPTWNKTVLDGSVKRALEKADPTRPVVAHSGVLPSLGSGGTDSHFYFGWYHGEERAFPTLCAAFPRLARFVTEFGAQAVPESAEFIDADRWPDLDWDLLGRAHALQRTAFDRYVPPAEYGTFDAWRKATQTYQSTVIRFHIETLRALKYRPTGIQVGRMRVPLGVVGIVYESRPNVTVDAAALCLKSGNACILRGGSEALHSNQAIAACVHQGLRAAGFAEDSVQLVGTTDRAAVGLLVTMHKYVDVLVPRGGKGLIQRVSD